MADQAQDANNDVAAKKKGGNSPWDEDLDIPEEPAKKSGPSQVIGSLDPQDTQEEKPVPFNVPEEIIEDKIAKKIPASEVMGTTKPVNYNPQPVGVKTSEAVPKPVVEQKPSSAVPPKPAAPAAVTTSAPSIAPQKPAESPPALAQATAPQFQRPKSFMANKKPVTPSQRFTVSKIEPAKAQPQASSGQVPQTSKPIEAPKVPAEAGGVAKEASAPAVIPEKSVSVKQGNEAPTVATQSSQKAPGIPSTPASMQDKPDQASKSSGGIAELLKKNNSSTQALPSSAAEEMPGPSFKTEESESEKNGASAVPVSKNADNNTKKVMDIQKPTLLIPKPEERVPTKVAEDESLPEIRVKLPAAAEIKPPAIPEINKKKSSLISRLNPFAKRSPVSPAKSVSSTTPQLASTIPAAPKAAPLEPPKPQSHARPGMPKSGGRLVYVFSFVILLAACIYLTEIGLLSIGLEKVYGIVGLEQLWGGLPRSFEPALAKTALKEQQNLSFKFNGKITATVDKTKKSPVTSPLVAFGGPVNILADISAVQRGQAKLTQYDYYGSDSSTTDSTTDTGSNSSVGDTDNGTSTTTTTTDTDSSSTSSDITSPTPDATSSSYGGDQSSLDSYNSDETTIKQLEFEVSGSSSDDAIASSIDLKPIVGSSKRIETIASGGSLFVQSNDIEFDDKAESGKWLEYKFPGLKSNNTLQDFLNIKFDSGFSTNGLRVGNDKLSDGRAYHYKIYNLEYGDVFSAYGLPSSAVDTISGDIWIGVHDHLLKKVTLEIVPSVASSISKLTVDLNFTDYGKENSITKPVLDDAILVTTPSTTTTESPTTTETPITTTTTQVDPKARVANDSQRNADLESIKSALNQYKSKNGRYPIAKDFANINQAGNILSKSLVSNYISAIPSDPNAANGWWYGYKSDGKTFTLSARFENIYDTEVTNVDGVYLHYVKN